MTILRTYIHEGKNLEIAVAEGELELASHAIRNPSVVRAPGAGKIEIGEIRVLGKPDKLSTKVRGENIAFLFVEILIKDSGNGYSYGPVYRNFIPSQRNKEVKGVLFPEWGNEVNVEYQFPLRQLLLSDGKNTAFAFLDPDRYTLTGECESSLRGEYILASGNKRQAVLSFGKDRVIKHVLGYKPVKKVNAPSIITPGVGDSFIPNVRILQPPLEEDGLWIQKNGLSNTLIFENVPFQLIETGLLPGDYLVGVVAKDLDGKFTRRYTSL